MHWILFLWFAIAVSIHLSMLISLISEPFELEIGTTLQGSGSHPQECSEFKGFWDPFFHDTDRVPRGLDFFSIYQSGYNFLHGKSVYYGVRNYRYEKKFFVVPYFSGFRYLPVYACLYGAALTIFQPWTAYWTWIAVVEILLLLNIYLMTFYTHDQRLRLLIAASWLAYSPYYIELHIGQQSMVTVTLLHFLGVMYLRHNRKLCDTGYILSVLWKLNTLLLLPVWLRMRRWKSMLILFASIIILSAPYFLFFPDSFKEFISYFHMKLIPNGPSSLGFWAFFASIYAHLNPHGSALRTILNSWNIVIILVSAAATFLPKKIDFISTFALWICIYFLTYQYVWEHHYVMLMPAISLLTGKERNMKWLWIWLFCALPTPYYFLNIPSLPMPQLQWTFIQDFIYHGIKIIPVLIMYGILVKRAFSKSFYNKINRGISTAPH